nr:MAG TPA: immunity protein [Caudoviricetes sp.]
MEGDNQSLASELLHEVKATSKRWFILFIITLLMLFGTNMAWLYAWNLPTEETITELTSDDGSNANYINGQGDITNGGDN